MNPLWNEGSLANFCQDFYLLVREYHLPVSNKRHSVGGHKTGGVGGTAQGMALPRYSQEAGRAWASLDFRLAHLCDGFILRFLAGIMTDSRP